MEGVHVAAGHPDVAKAAALAAADQKWGERPVLIAVTRSSRSIERDALLEPFKGRVPKLWVPDFVLVVDELPHGPIGKVQKQKLRERYREVLAASAKRV